MRSSRLYLATRSERDGAPVLIWPVPMRDDEVGDRRVLGLAGAVRHDAPSSRRRRASSIASIVSVSVPIWLSLMRTAFAASSSIAAARSARCS